MLVLSRKKNESIVVDEAIVITVLEIRGDKVRLGIEAPKSVPIHRSEVYAAIQSQQTPVEPAVASEETTPPPAP
jgi:carbon storage regulator